MCEQVRSREVPVARAIGHDGRMRARRPRGQSLTEVVLIVALVAIGTLGIVGLYGDNVRHLFAVSSDNLAGKGNVANQGQRGSRALTNKTVKNFAQTSRPGGGPMMAK